jgi:gamma-glutamyl hydrolase
MLLFFALLACALALAGSQPNPRPVIGILSLPNDEWPSNGRSQFPASYVKFLEAGGSRVVPIPFDLSPAALSTLLSQLNGALFTGGAAAFTTPSGALSQYARTASAIFNESVAAAGAGETWPLWGTCLGFELISFLAAEGSSVLTTGWASENLTAVVDWAPQAAASRLWSSDATRAVFATQRIAFNAHTQGVAPEAFAAAPALASRFTALGTSVDRTGKAFVSTMEGKALPIYATQWHPEKALFEWPEDWTEYIPVECATASCTVPHSATLDPSPIPAHPPTHFLPAAHAGCRELQLARHSVLCGPGAQQQPQLCTAPGAGQGPDLQLPASARPVH